MTKPKKKTSHASHVAVLEDPSIGALRHYVGVPLRLAHRAVIAGVTELFNSLELTPGEFGVLVVIDHNPEATQGHIGRLLQMQKGNFAPLIGRFEKRGLVVREACSADGRKQRMRLTASGNALVARGIELNNAFEAHVIAHMGLPQHQELIRLLNVLRRVPPYTKAAAKAAIPRRAPLKKKSIPQG